ncbi:MAG: MotA/TolQ/ExbB proton channel family protein [Pirellulales bacterium]
MQHTLADHAVPASTTGDKDLNKPTLSWARSDIEQRLGFRGARYTSVNNLLSFLCACLLTIIFYASVVYCKGTYFAEMFLDRGFVPYFIVFFSAWSCAILFIKWRKLKLQERALSISFIPDQNDFVLSPATVGDVLASLFQTVDDPKRFIVLNRVLVALSNLKNLGRVTDVEEILRSQSEHDEAAMETSYALLRGFIWAIPVLGFIGTVVGLSYAIGAFGGVLGTATEINDIADSLKGVTAGLATAFETTLEALVAALAIQLVLTFLKKSEEEFLDSCREYCHRNIVNRLRMTPFDQQVE